MSTTPRPWGRVDAADPLGLLAPAVVAVALAAAGPPLAAWFALALVAGVSLSGST